MESFLGKDQELFIHEYLDESFWLEQKLSTNDSFYVFPLINQPLYLFPQLPGTHYERSVVKNHQQKILGRDSQLIGELFDHRPQKRPKRSISSGNRKPTFKVRRYLAWSMLRDYQLVT